MIRKEPENKVADSKKPGAITKKDTPESPLIITPFGSHVCFVFVSSG